MDTEKRVAILGKLARRRWGARAQIIKACEELGELTTILCKALNGSPHERTDIVDEIADVLIVTTQMKYMFQSWNHEVESRMNEKLDRLEAALNREDAASDVMVAVDEMSDVSKETIDEMDALMRKDDPVFTDPHSDAKVSGNDLLSEAELDLLMCKSFEGHPIVMVYDHEKNCDIEGTMIKVPLGRGENVRMCSNCFNRIQFKYVPYGSANKGRSGRKDEGQR